jgi:hypothetical protein
VPLVSTSTAACRPGIKGENDMTVLGWTFLIVSLAFVWGLTIWCYYKVFTVKGP